MTPVKPSSAQRTQSSRLAAWSSMMQTGTFAPIAARFASAIQ